MRQKNMTKKINRNKQTSETCEKCQIININLILIPKGEAERWEKKEEIMVDNFQNLMKMINSQI